MANKILITGGAGFIGLHLASKLVGSGEQVDIIDDFSRGLRDEALAELLNDNLVTVLNYDLCKREFIDKLATDYDFVYHLAAIVGVENTLSDPFKVLCKNSLATINLLTALESQRNLKRLVFASTSEVYAGSFRYFNSKIPTPEATPITLTDLKEPRTSYMASKAYGEALCHQSSLPFSIIRPHNIYGPRMGMSHVIPQLMRRVFEAPDCGQLVVYSPSHTRTFCYIDDAVDLMEKVCRDASCEGKTLNIGSSSPEITMKSLGKLVCETIGKPLEIEKGPDSPGSPARRCPDMTLTESLITRTITTTLQTGIRKTYEWYLKNSFLNSVDQK